MSREQETDDPHVPTPLEYELPGGDLAVARKRFRDYTGTVIDAADRPLYELLMNLLENVHVPDLMPAALADTCTDLVDVRETVLDIDRGSVHIEGYAQYGMSYCHNVRDAVVDHRDREPLRLVVVGCSGSKHDVDGRVPARELYARAYWTCKRDYGETIGDGWRIVSAEHALLDPDEPIEYYERTPADLRNIPIDSERELPSGEPVETLLDKWAADVHDGLTEWLEATAGGIDPRDVDLEVLLGRSYRDPLENRDVFTAIETAGDLEISFPFQEIEQAQGGNGHQMDWMTDEVAAATAVATDGGGRK